MSINVKQGDGKAPKALAQAIVAGQAFPFVAQLTHKARKPLVVPSSGINGLIPPGQPVAVTIKSYEQAWVLVTDLAALAALSKSQDEDFATIEVPAVVKATSKTKATSQAAAGGDGK